MAEIRRRRRLIRGAFAVVALAAGLVASAFAQPPVALRSPSWAELPPAEKQVLAPLAGDWDKMEAQRKQKWRAIAQRYPKLSPDDQAKVRENMHTWASLTPQQRQAAREQYKAMKQLPPEKKQDVQQRWQEYSSLPPEKKRELAAKAPPTPVTGSTSGKPAAAPANPPPGAAPTPGRRPRLPGKSGVSRDTAAPPATQRSPWPNASLARRLASLSYESTILAALMLVAGFVTLPLVPPTPPGGALAIPDAPARALSLAVVFGVGAVYCVASWSGARRTLPMKTWRIALVRCGGGQVDRRIAFTRYVLAWAGPVLALGAYVALRPLGAGALALPLVALNFLWALVDPDRQFLHDRIAGTRLVTTPP